MPPVPCPPVPVPPVALLPPVEVDPPVALLPPVDVDPPVADEPPVPGLPGLALPQPHVKSALAKMIRQTFVLPTSTPDGWLFDTMCGGL